MMGKLRKWHWCYENLYLLAETSANLDTSRIIFRNNKSGLFTVNLYIPQQSILLGSNLYLLNLSE